MKEFTFLRSIGCDPPQLVVPHPEMIACNENIQVKVANKPSVYPNTLTQSPGISALVGQHAG